MGDAETCNVLKVEWLCLHIESICLRLALLRLLSIVQDMVLRVAEPLKVTGSVGEGKSSLDGWISCPPPNPNPAHPPS